MAELPAEGLRLDIWLWRARFFRTRALATEHVNRRGIRISRNGETRKTTKPGTRIGPGDLLTFSRAQRLERIQIIELGTRRGPAPEAQALYSRIETETEHLWPIF